MYTISVRKEKTLDLRDLDFLNRTLYIAGAVEEVKKVVDDFKNITTDFTVEVKKTNVVVSARKTGDKWEYRVEIELRNMFRQEKVVMLLEITDDTNIIELVEKKLKEEKEKLEEKIRRRMKIDELIAKYRSEGWNVLVEEV